MQKKDLLYNLTLLLLAIFLSSCSPLKNYKVPTAGMEPTILAEEEISTDLDAYRSATVQPGDVVTFKNPKNESIILVKRCVAVQGQTISIRQGIVYVDNKPFLPTLETKRTDSTIKPVDYNDPSMFPECKGNIDNYGPLTIPSGKCFLIGDHRDNSLDSRHFGFVDIKSITGKVQSISNSTDLSRIGKKVL